MVLAGSRGRSAPEPEAEAANRADEVAPANRQRRHQSLLAQPLLLVASRAERQTSSRPSGQVAHHPFGCRIALVDRARSWCSSTKAQPAKAGAAKLRILASSVTPGPTADATKDPKTAEPPENQPDEMNSSRPSRKEKQHEPELGAPPQQ